MRIEIEAAHDGRGWTWRAFDPEVLVPRPDAPEKLCALWLGGHDGSRELDWRQAFAEAHAFANDYAQQMMRRWMFDVSKKNVDAVGREG